MDPSLLSPLVFYVLAALLVLAGIAGTVLPALPGIPLVFAGLLLAAWAGDFLRVGGWTIAALAALTLFSVLVDFWATAAGARRVGASRQAIAGAVAGTVVGMFFGLPGLFLGPFVGAVAGELLARRRFDRAHLGQATRVGVGTWVGLVFGTALKLMLAFAMLGIFVMAWFT